MQIASTMGNQADVHSESMYRGFAMAEMLHHLSVILLLIALVFLYSMDSAVAISVSPVVVTHERCNRRAYPFPSWMVST